MQVEEAKNQDREKIKAKRISIDKRDERKKGEASPCKRKKMVASLRP